MVVIKTYELTSEIHLSLLTVKTNKHYICCHLSHVVHVESVQKQNMIKIQPQLHNYWIYTTVDKRGFQTVVLFTKMTDGDAFLFTAEERDKTESDMFVSLE